MKQISDFELRIADFVLAFFQVTQNPKSEFPNPKFNPTALDQHPFRAHSLD